MAALGRDDKPAAGVVLHLATADEAWAGAKTSDVPDELARINQVRSALSPLLTSAAFGTRLSAVQGRGVRATNVLTYVDKLAGLAGDAEIRKWYDWLSDAAHPACGARIAGSSDPFMHNTRAIMLRYHDRSPLHLEGPGGVTRFQYPIATQAADAIASCGSLIVRILDQMLKVVTTSASPLRPRPTPRATYWRNFRPTRGNRRCPCGRGRWAECAHLWGRPAPAVQIRADAT
jgi:hypothetical protein